MKSQRSWKINNAIHLTIAGLYAIALWIFLVFVVPAHLFIIMGATFITVLSLEGLSEKLQTYIPYTPITEDNYD